MNALFLVFHGFAPYNGISKKISYQMKAFENLGFKTELCYLEFDESGNQVRMIDGTPLISYGKGIKAKILKRIEFGILYRHIVENDIRYVYLRYDHNANPFTINLIRRLKAKGVVVDMEVPTYPYDSEYDKYGFFERLPLFIDKIFRKRFARYIHRIVTFSDYDYIFGKQTIKISNGINFEEIKIKGERNSSDNSFNLIAVADIHFWHGFDRVSAGLVNYYSKVQKMKVLFHVVGGSSWAEYNRIMDVAKAGHVDEYIIFHEQLFGEELDSVFDDADFGIASLGRHRCGITRIKTLKSREYAARGIPFIYSEIDDDFENMPYIMKAPPDETPIDITSIVEFCSNHKFTPTEIRSSIEGKLTWEKQMKIVTDQMNN